MITPICPFCNSPIFGRWISEPESSEGYYDLSCSGSDGHFYGVHAATEEEARAIVLKPQKILADALSARIALPIEQRRHNEARAQLNQATTIIADFFSHTVMIGLQETPPRTWLYSWERRAIEWLRKTWQATPICAWTAAYIKHGPPPWGERT